MSNPNPEPKTNDNGRDDLDELSRLFSEATSEWHALAESLHDLKEELEPTDFEKALEHLNIPDLEEIKSDWNETESAARTNQPGERVVEAERDLGPPHPKPQPKEESAAEPSTEIDSDIRDRLSELAGLVKEHLSTSSRVEQPTVEVPQDLTLKIAREVASRVNASVVESMRDGEPTQAPGEAAPTEQKESKKIPIDDIAAMIDQLTDID